MKIKSLFASFWLVAAIILMGIINADAEAAETFTPAQKTEIETIVHDYLVKNPQVLVEVSKALQVEEQEQIIQRAEKAIAEHADGLFNAAMSPVIGNPQGNVNVVEFFDYQCIHCRNMSAIISHLTTTDKELRVVFKELPIFGGDSQYAAKAALASQKQGKYLAFHDALMKAEKPLTQDKVLRAAKSVKINIQTLQKDIKDKAIDEELNNNFKLAQALGVMGTPAFVVAANPFQGKPQYVPGATSQENLLDLINQVRAQK